ESLAAVLRDVIGAAERLVADPEAGERRVPYDEMFERLVCDVELPYVYQALESYWARRYSLDLCGMAERSGALMKAAVEAQPSDRVMNYWRRLSRCIILGLWPEMVILCRCVLEAAINDLYDRKRAAGEHASSVPPSMRKKLERAVDNGWLSALGSQTAWNV